MPLNTKKTRHFRSFFGSNSGRSFHISFLAFPSTGGKFQRTATHPVLAANLSRLHGSQLQFGAESDPCHGALGGTIKVRIYGNLRGRPLRETNG